MRWSLLVGLMVILVICEAGRVKREHKHTKHHHNQHVNSNTKKHHSGHSRSPLHLKRVSTCYPACKEGQICVEGSPTSQPLCVRKHFLRQSQRLMREFQKHHPDIKYTDNPEQTHHSKPHLESPHNVQISVHQQHHTEAKHHEVGAKQHEMKHSNHKHHNEVNKKMHRLLEIHQNSGRMNQKHHGKKTHVCSSGDFNDMRQRLTGWFRLLHAQEKEQRHSHHGNHHHHHKKHHHMSVKKELRDHHDGKCRAQPSVMWELHHLDKDDDHHLTVTELSDIENNAEEPCLRPFLDSCDTDRDGKLSSHEWRCCFAEAIAPCYAKLRDLQRDLLLETAPFVPRCDREGYYEKEQCRGRTMESRTCWCVDLNGNEISNTRARVRAHCEKVDVLGHLKKKH